MYAKYLPSLCVTPAWIVLVGDGDVGDVRGLVVAGQVQRGVVAAIAAMIAAVGIRRFHRRHHAIGERAVGAREGERGLVDHLIAEQRVALHLVVVVADHARRSTATSASCRCR